MKIETKPWAGGLLAALLWLAFCVWAVVLGSCAHYPPPKAEPGALRTPEQARLAAVAVVTECGSGSGVLVDGRHVLTAHHVIDCDRTDRVRLATSVKVHLTSGSIYVVKYDALDASRDLARLLLPSEVDASPLMLARTMPGQVVCAVTATPAREVHCGLVGSEKLQRDRGDIHIRGAQLWFGNSGSALYNTDGALVGIVVRMYFCDDIDAMLWKWFDVKPERTCGGRASSPEGPVML